MGRGGPKRRSRDNPSVPLAESLALGSAEVGETGVFKPPEPLCGDSGLSLKAEGKLCKVSGWGCVTECMFSITCSSSKQRSELEVAGVNGQKTKYEALVETGMGCEDGKRQAESGAIDMACFSRRVREEEMTPGISATVSGMNPLLHALQPSLGQDTHIHRSCLKHGARVCGLELVPVSPCE